MPSLTLNNWREGAGGAGGAWSALAGVDDWEETGEVVLEELDVWFEARLLSPGR